jgi:hypothetical protein
MEQQLRELLIAEAGDPPRRVTVEAVRRRAVRRWAVQAGAVGLAVVLAVGLGAAVSAGVLRFGTPTVGSTGQHTGPPRYYIGQNYDSKTRNLVLSVRSRTSGRVTAVVRAPLAGENCGQGNVGVASADDQTFFMTCAITRWGPGKFGPRSKPLSVRTYIYRFQVTSSGRITGYSLVRGGVLKGMFADNIAATPDGSELAVEVTGIAGTLYTNTLPGGILVINTRTGSTALWKAGPNVPGTLQYAGANDLSFTADGRDLVATEARCHRRGHRSYCNGHADMQVRAYSPADRGGSLEGGRVLVQGASLKPRGAHLSDAFITPDGSAVAAAVVDCPPHEPCTLTVARIPVGTGGGQRVLYQVQSGNRNAGIFFRFFSADPSRRYLILDAGTSNARVNGWIDHGKLVPLTPADGNAPTYEAW